MNDIDYIKAKSTARKMENQQVAHVAAEVLIFGGVCFMINQKQNSTDERVNVLEKKLADQNEKIEDLEKTLAYIGRYINYGPMRDPHGGRVDPRYVDQHRDPQGGNQQRIEQHREQRRDPQGGKTQHKEQQRREHEGGNQRHREHEGKRTDPKRRQEPVEELDMDMEEELKELEEDEPRREGKHSKHIHKPDKEDPEDTSEIIFDDGVEDHNDMNSVVTPRKDGEKKAEFIDPDQFKNLTKKKKKKT